VIAAEHLDQLVDGQVGLHAALLEDDADLLAQGAGAGGRVYPEDACLPR
jgi:hypothetical protein